MSDKEVTSTNDQTQSKKNERQERRPPHRRGKGSKKKSDQKFRENKNAEFVKAQDADLANLQRPAKQYLAQLDVSVTSSTTVQQLPICTRGVGFISVESWRNAQQTLPNANITPQLIFRVSLYQLEEQMMASKAENGMMIINPAIPSQTIGTLKTLDSTGKGRKANFLPMTYLLNNAGDFRFQDMQFNVCIPDDRHPSKTMRIEGRRVRVEVDGKAPSPYTVTLSNLEFTVNYLSDIANPVAYRQYFEDRNPLPGARWNANHVLLNPQDFWPPGYGPAQLDDEAGLLANYLGNFKQRIQWAQGAATLNGKGSSAQLLRNDVKMKTGTLEDRLVTFNVDGQDHYSHHKLENHCAYVGILSLFGEIPDPLPVNNIITEPTPPFFGFRINCAGYQRFVASWKDSLNVIFDRPYPRND